MMYHVMQASQFLSMHKPGGRPLQVQTGQRPTAAVKGSEERENYTYASIFLITE